MAGFLAKAQVLYQAVQVLRPIVEPQPVSLRPFEFWQNQFVMGFVFGIISTVEAELNSALTASQRYDVCVMVYKKLGQRPPFDAERIQKEGEPAFNEGVLYAQTLNGFAAKLQETSPASPAQLKRALFVNGLKKWLDVD